MGTGGGRTREKSGEKDLDFFRLGRREACTKIRAISIRILFSVGQREAEQTSKSCQSRQNPGMVKKGELIKMHPRRELAWACLGFPGFPPRGPMKTFSKVC